MFLAIFGLSVWHCLVICADMIKIEYLELYKLHIYVFAHNKTSSPWDNSHIQKWNYFAVDKPMELDHYFRSELSVQLWDRMH